MFTYDIKNAERTVSYFSMEIGIASNIPTYSGGLGILAGDTVKAFADLHVPAVAVTLLYWKGYFRQELDAEGNQRELPVEWDPAKYLRLLPGKITVKAHGREVLVQAWQYEYAGMDGFRVPVLFLDTALEENNEYDRRLTDHLYGGNDEYRLTQEAILGIGGVRMLKALGFTGIRRYHMNEGHSSLLALELLREENEQGRAQANIAGVKRRCVFTTHTPVPAGHDQFPYPLVDKVLGDYVPRERLRALGGKDVLNLTLLALNTSHYINGVAGRHTQVSREMFPGYAIDAITNGIHAGTWTSAPFARLFSEYIPRWQTDPYSLRYALSIPGEKVRQAHREAKRALVGYVKENAGTALDEEVFTIGFARRATAYKRADLLFRDLGRLRDIARRSGRMQLVFSGKAHPRDAEGKEMIKKIFAFRHQLGKEVPIAYVEDYNMETARVLISGVDLWLNTPRKPLEASGTSGMKAALNGVPSCSILDGWWIEGCIEGLTGWAIEPAKEAADVDGSDADALYAKLAGTVIPLFYNRQDAWVDVMRHAISINGSFFNAHRMVLQYVLDAYYLAYPRIEQETVRVMAR